jgi:hypothetical protein
MQIVYYFVWNSKPAKLNFSMWPPERFSFDVEHLLGLSSFSPHHTRPVHNYIVHQFVFKYFIFSVFATKSQMNESTNFTVPVSLSECSKSETTEWLFIKRHIRDFHSNLSTNFKYSSNQTTVTNTLRENLKLFLFASLA